MEVFSERDTTREIFDTVSDIDLICRTPEFAGTNYLYLLSFEIHSIIYSCISIEVDNRQYMNDSPQFQWGISQIGC